MEQTAAKTKLAMRRSVWIDSDPERIWKEFETADVMKEWWETGPPSDQRLARYEPGETGWFEIAGTHGTFEYRLGGRILEWSPPTRLVRAGSRLLAPQRPECSTALKQAGHSASSWR